MSLEQARAQGAQYVGFSKTGHEQFDKDGFLLLPDFIDVSSLKRKPGDKNQLIKYRESEIALEGPAGQTPGSIETYRHPSFKKAFQEVRRKLQHVLGKRLFETYYFDRFYFAGQDLFAHCDRPACQISITIHIDSTIEKPWPFFGETPDLQTKKFLLKPGDAVLYKGIERPHWREPLECTEDDYYHQVFMHYVLQDGHFVEYAFDAPGSG